MIIIQMFIILLICLTICCALSTVLPAAYHSKNDKSKNHQKFQYGYEIAGPSGSQLREEQRDGAYALGRYYVLGGDANQKVEYLADNWGFHPYVEYSNVGPHSKSATQIAHGEEAVKAFHNSRANKKNIFENKLQQNTLKLHRVQLDTPQQQQQKKTSKPLKVVSSPQRHKEVKQISPQSQQNQYYPPKQELPQQLQYYPPKQELPQQPQYILEPPPQAQPNQIPIYFIQSGYANPPQQDDYLFPSPQDTLQTTILVPVKSNLPAQQPEYYQQPLPQLYFNGIQPPSALPLIFEPPELPPQALINPPHQSIVLENIQDNIKNQLLEEQNHQKQNIENLYGRKITTKLKIKSSSGTLPHEKLIESTKELVTAQDVININESLENKDAVNQESYYYVTPKSPRLSENPIVVQDPADNSLITAEQYRSTTQNTLEIAEFNNVLSSSSTEPTILVTPRPQLGSSHLAPINAAIQLQSIENQEVQATIKTPVQTKKQNVVVEIQKSVPYYLGKFEFVQEAAKAKNVQPSNGEGDSKYKYDVSAETAENFELGKTILSSFDNFVAAGVSSTKQPFQEQTNNLDQHQESGQIQYQVVPAQSLVRDSIIKPADIPTIMAQQSPTILIPRLEPESTIVSAAQPLYAPRHNNYGQTRTTVCDHQYHSGAVTYLSKVPDTTKPISNDVFPTSKPLGTILETYNNSPNENHSKQVAPIALSYKTIDLHGSATRDSLGLVPPMPHQVAAPYYRPHRGVYQLPVQQQQHGAPKKYRHARQSFADNLRVEYGFMPPLIPSVEIDEHGRPIEKADS